MGNSGWLKMPDDLKYSQRLLILGRFLVLTDVLDSLWLQENSFAHSSFAHSSFHYPRVLRAFSLFAIERRAPKWDQAGAGAEEQR